MDPDLLRMIPPLLLVLAVGGLVIALMLRSWRRRARAQDGSGALPTAPAPADGTPLVGPFAAVYVSTTEAGNRLARVHGHTLGERSNATLTLARPAGGEPVLHVARQGAESFALPAGIIRAAAPTSGLAGKSVGGEGILALRWTLHAGTPASTDVVTGFRLRHRAEHDELLAALGTDLTPADSPGESA